MNDNPLRATAVWLTQILEIQPTFEEKKRRVEEVQTICRALFNMMHEPKTYYCYYVSERE